MAAVNALAGRASGFVGGRLSPALARDRPWESRYGLLQPVRSPGGFRLHSEADKSRIRPMRAYLADGLSAAEAARPRSAATQMLPSVVLAARVPGGPGAASAPNPPQSGGPRLPSPDPPRRRSRARWTPVRKAGDQVTGAERTRWPR